MGTRSSGKQKTETPELRLSILLKQDGQEFTALCVDLDIASFGKSPQEAVESLKDLLALYLADCVQDGEEPIPLRPVPPEVLREFVKPPEGVDELTITSREESFEGHAAPR